MRLFNLFLDRLEEWLIAALIAAATILTFVAVLHRYGASNFAELARWGGAHGLTHVHGAADRAYVASLMGRVAEPGQYANWISPPLSGINKQPLDIEYVRFN